MVLNGLGFANRALYLTPHFFQDHRPDLNQIVSQLICERQASIPLLMKPLSGDSSDKTDFLKTVQAHIDQMKNDFSLKYPVADSALYTVRILKKLNDIVEFPCTEDIESV